MFPHSSVTHWPVNGSSREEAEVVVHNIRIWLAMRVPGSLAKLSTLRYALPSPAHVFGDIRPSRVDFRLVNPRHVTYLQATQQVRKCLFLRGVADRYLI